MTSIYVFFGTILASLVTSFIIRLIATHWRWGMDTLSNVPRIGGLAIIITVCTTSLWVADGAFNVMGCALIVSAIGMLDDIGLGVGPLLKLAVSLIAATLAISLTKVYVANINTPFLSPLLDYTPIAVGISILVLAGMCHAVNLIDGIHGLALSFSTLIFLSLGFVGFSIGDACSTLIALATAGSCLGLLILNFPSGSIFLGDIGSYFLGFISAWLAIYICFHYPIVSPWAMFCIFIYPIVEVSYSTARRLISGKNPFKGDMEHLHHKILRLTGKLQNKALHEVVVTSSVACTLLAAIPVFFATLHYSAPNILLAIAATSASFLVAINWITSLASKKWCPTKN